MAWMKGAPLRHRLRALQGRAGAPEAGQSVRHVGEHVPVVADVHVAVPNAGDEGFSTTVDQTRSLGCPNRSGRTYRTNLPLGHEHDLVLNEGALVGIE